MPKTHLLRRFVAQIELGNDGEGEDCSGDFGVAGVSVKYHGGALPYPVRVGNGRMI